MAELPYPERLDDGAGVSLRLVAEDDAETLTAWLRDPAVHRGWGGRPLSLSEVRDKYTGARLPDVVSYVVERDGEACGYLQAWWADGRCGLDMFVAGHAQGRGTGPRAAALLARRLDALGWRPLTVDPADPAAIAAWVAAGFAPDTGRPAEDGTVAMTWHDGKHPTLED